MEDLAIRIIARQQLLLELRRDLIISLQPDWRYMVGYDLLDLLPERKNDG
jgi:hypothetical protein